MTFTRPEFLLLFLPWALFVWWSLRDRPLAAQWSLVANSCLFYGLWDVQFLGLLIALTLANYALGKQLAKTRSTKLLVIGLAGNLGVLAWFKYTNWFYDIASSWADWPARTWSIILPLGISFFAFQKIAFLVDCKRGLVTDFSVRKFSAFVSFFPQLIAGPITHHAEVTHQLADRPRKFDQETFSQGLLLFLLGLVKKVWLADSFAPMADRLFGLAQSSDSAMSMAQGWSAACAYAAQLYLDFSGYADMAIGMALMFGIALPANFNAPYQALSITDFWRRWHMTLSRFLRDYLYIPLGGNRNGFVMGLAAAFLTMLLGGLWHGAALTFVSWGALHGAALCAHRIWQRFGFSMPTWTARLITLLFVLVAWVPFRAHSMDQAWTIWTAMFTGPFILPVSHVLDLTMSVGAILILATLQLSAVTWVRQRMASGLASVWRPAFALSAVAGFGLYRSTSFLYWTF